MGASHETRDHKPPLAKGGTQARYSLMRRRNVQSSGGAVRITASWRSEQRGPLHCGKVTNNHCCCELIFKVLTFVTSIGQHIAFSSPLARDVTQLVTWQQATSSSKTVASCASMTAATACSSGGSLPTVGGHPRCPYRDARVEAVRFDGDVPNK